MQDCLKKIVLYIFQMKEFSHMASAYLLLALDKY